STLTLGGNYEEHTLIAVDPEYLEVLAGAGLGGLDDLRALMDAAEAWAPSDPVPALASQSLRDLDFDEGTRVYAGRVHVPVEFIDTATTVPDGWVDGPYVIVPRGPFMATEFESPVEIG